MAVKYTIPGAAGADRGPATTTYLFSARYASHAKTARTVGAGIAQGVSRFQAGDAATRGEMVGEVLSPLLSAGALPAEAAAVTRAAGRVTRGESGRFADLVARGVKADKLTPHHMPQAAAAFTSRADGGALMMLEAEHVLTRTYGFRGALTAQHEAGMTFRDVLARDVRDVRRIVGSEYNNGLRGLLDYYRAAFPDLMTKK